MKLDKIKPSEPAAFASDLAMYCLLLDCENADDRHRWLEKAEMFLSARRAPTRRRSRTFALLFRRDTVAMQLPTIPVVRKTKLNRLPQPALV